MIGYSSIEFTNAGFITKNCVAIDHLFWIEKIFSKYK